jgi:hypothetical protein
MEKIFHNSCSFDRGGLFICEVHGLKRPWPCNLEEANVFLDEITEAHKKLHEELVGIALDLRLNIMDWHGVPYVEGEEIQEVVLDDFDGARLTKALLEAGWKKEFILFGL